MVGLVGRDPSFSPPTMASVRGQMFGVGASTLFYRALGQEWAAIPDTCWGRPDSEFQQGKCEEVWLHLGKVTAVGLLPLGVFLAFALFALDSLKLTYKRIRKR